MRRQLPVSANLVLWEPAKITRAGARFALLGRTSMAIMKGTDGKDAITGGPENDTISGPAGKDLIPELAATKTVGSAATRAVTV
jgi:hypothetical protein